MVARLRTAAQPGACVGTIGEGMLSAMVNDHTGQMPVQGKEVPDRVVEVESGLTETVKLQPRQMFEFTLGKFYVAYE